MTDTVEEAQEELAIALSKVGLGSKAKQVYPPIVTGDLTWIVITLVLLYMYITIVIVYRSRQAIVHAHTSVLCVMSNNVV